MYVTAFVCGALIAFAPLADHLWQGQTNLLVGCLIMAGLYLVRAKRSLAGTIAAGGLIACGCLLKVFPVLLLPLLFVLLERRVVFAMSSYWEHHVVLSLPVYFAALPLLTMGPQPSLPLLALALVALAALAWSPEFVGSLEMLRVLRIGGTALTRIIAETAIACRERDRVAP